MGGLGFQEMLLIFVIALIVFGPRKLPEIGRTMGRAFGEFRRATDELKNSLETEVELEKGRSTRPTPASAAVPSSRNDARSPAEESHEPPVVTES